MGLHSPSERVCMAVACWNEPPLVISTEVLQQRSLINNRQRKKSTCKKVVGWTKKSKKVCLLISYSEKQGKTKTKCIAFHTSLEE